MDAAWPTLVFIACDRLAAQDRPCSAHVLAAIPGGGHCRLNGIPVAVPADAVLLAQEGDRLAGPATGLAVRFRFGGAGTGAAAERMRIFAAGIQPPQQVVAIVRDEWEPLAQALATECGRSDGAAIAQALATALAGRVLRQVPGECRASPPSSPIADRLAVLFRRHEGRRLDVRAMARDLGMSERQLTDICRSRLGLPPARAFTAHRVARAAELLVATDWPIKAVADRLGFSNPFHFSRVFHRCHGCTPSAFRARALPAVGA